MFGDVLIVIGEIWLGLVIQGRLNKHEPRKSLSPLFPSRRQRWAGKQVRHWIPRSAKKGFLIVHRKLAEAAFRDNMPNDILIKKARRELRYSPKTADVDIWISLHLVWRSLDA